MTTRNIVNSAKARASIIAALSATPKQTLAEIEALPGLEKLGLSKSAIHALVYRMLKNFLLVNEKSEEGRMVYSAGASSPAPERAIKIAKPRTSTIADLKVDIIKATGRIRLTLNGFTVDIGVAG